MKKILLVNDCKFESIVMKDLLTQLNFKVEITNEYEALNYLKLFNPEMVIANLVMKETTGDKLIYKIKNIKPNIVCILSSCGAVNKEQYKDTKVDGVINTPVKMESLKELLKALLPEESQEKSATLGFSFCPYCGKNLKSVEMKIKFCPHCGKDISNN